MSVTSNRRRPRPLTVGIAALVVAVIGAGAWVLTTTGNASSDPSVTTSSTTRAPTSSGPLAAPKASVAQDAQYLSEVTEADPALATYEKKSGNVALRALLTDGSAFCAFLNRDRDMDTAMVSVVVGARQVESESHLPMTVTTFNAVDAVALLTLCPSLLSVVPQRDLVNIRQLGAALTGPAN
jgi:hypothetical protein